MNDRAEQAFRDAFAEHAAEHIEPVRPRRRFDARWAVAAAVALVVLAVPLTVYLQSRGVGPADPVVASPATGSPTAPSGPVAPLSGLPEPKADDWRWVSRGDVAVQVPSSWPYSNYSWMPWCLNGATEPLVPEGPYVDSPEGVVPAIGCEPLAPEYVRMHVGFGAPTDGRPSTERKMKAVGSSGVYVVLERDATDADRALADEILATAVTFERDAAGCAPTAPFSSVDDRPEPWDIATAAGGSDISVGICRYEERFDDLEGPSLAGSWVMTDDIAVADFLEGIATSPEGVSGNPNDCVGEYAERSGVVLRVRDDTGIHDVYLRVDGCRNLGFDDGVTQRKLTDACRLAFAVDPVLIYSGQGEVMDVCWTEPGTSPATTRTSEPAAEASPTQTTVVDGPYYEDAAALVRASDLVAFGRVTDVTEKRLEEPAVDVRDYTVELVEVLAGEASSPVTVRVIVSNIDLGDYDQPMLFLTRMEGGHYELTGWDQGVMVPGDGERYVAIAGWRTDLGVDPGDTAWMKDSIGADR